MGTFDYAAAKAAGVSDADIHSFLAQKRAEGNVVTFANPVPSAVMPEVPYYGATPDVPAPGGILNAPLSPIDFISLPSAGAVRGAVGAIGGILGRGGAALEHATAPVVDPVMEMLGRRLFGNEQFNAMMAKAEADAMARIGGQAAAEVPAAAAPQVAPAVFNPIIGRAEAAAYKAGGQPALEAAQAMRGVPTSLPPAPLPAPIAAAAEATAPQAPRAVKEATAYWQRRTYAMMKQAGMPTGQEESRTAISQILGRPIKSRSELSIEDWVKVHDAATEKLMQDAAEQAAQKAAARAATKASKGLPPKAEAVAEAEIKATARAKAAQATLKAVPKPATVGTGPSFTVPGSLEDQLRQSLQLEDAMKSLGVTPEQKVELLRMLAQQKAS